MLKVCSKHSIVQYVDYMRGRGVVAPFAPFKIHYCLQGQAFLAAKIAQKVFGILEQLNVIVQRRSMSVCGMVEAVNIVNARLETLRSSEEFEILFNETKKAIDINSLLYLKLPRTHNPPSRYTGQAFHLRMIQLNHIIVKFILK